MLVALTLAVMLGGCSKNTTPTGLDPALDQAPPAIPAQIVAEKDASAGTASLDWTPSSSASASSYEIYQYSPSPERESAYALVGETDAATTHYTLPLTSQNTAYYRLRTVSTAGVKSEWSATTQVSSAGPGSASEDPEGTRER
jgi:predicted phage tail protein